MVIDRRQPVLIVDDYGPMRRVLRSLLRQLGFADVDEAEDGAAALALLRHRPYGLVISDWNMRPVTGLDLLREVRADPRLASLPFVMLTAESKTENVIAAREAGASSYVVKPFDAEILRAKIAGLASAA